MEYSFLVAADARIYSPKPQIRCAGNANSAAPIAVIFKTPDQSASAQGCRRRLCFQLETNSPAAAGLSRWAVKDSNLRPWD
jgi:hypothetical protein